MRSFLCFDDWLEFSKSDDYLRAKTLLRRVNLKFWLSPQRTSQLFGICEVCGLETYFSIDDKHSIRNNLGGVSQSLFRKKVNFRERLECSHCHLNQRMRSAVALVNHVLNKGEKSEVWIQEAITPLWRIFQDRYPGLVGSEYFGSEVISGHFVDGVRHEDATSASFESDSLDGVLSFDVLEHVPSFQAAFDETFRVLRKGGVFCWSAPFNLQNPTNEVRAFVNNEGQIIHILTPEYHGDPVNPDEGILCFQTFGWEVLENLRRAGFRDVKLFWHNDPLKGILSLENVFILGHK